MEVEWPIVILITNAVMGVFLVITVMAIGRFVRRQFKARVNCWFCNRTTWVPYLDRNKWTCPFSGCEQYNGFKEDGDYNVELRAQYSPKCNQQVFTHRQSSTQSPLAFCEGCNRNQELKVHQLASFQPTDENNYEEEIENYKEHLEDVYRLCPGCERIVKRKLNQAKTLILGLKRRVKVKRSATPENIGWGKRVKRFVAQLLLLAVVLLLGQYFVCASSQIFTIVAYPGMESHFQAFASFWNDTGLLTLGYRLALGATILVLLAKGEPMNLIEYLSISSLCALHFLIGEKSLEQFSFYPLIADLMPTIEWVLRVFALLSSIGSFVEALRPVTASVKLNDSFHRIEVDDEVDDSTSVYTTTNFGGRLDTSTDFGSVFEYQHTVAPSNTNASTLEDEEIRSISFNSARKSFLNRSDPLTSQYQQSPPAPTDTWSEMSHLRASGRPSVSTLQLHSPSKLYPDDRFSNSVKSMRIGTEYHQIRSPGENPFLKNIPLTPGPSSLLSSSSNTLRASSRSLLTPSRLSLVSGGGQSAFRSAAPGLECKRKNAWASSASGFWTNHYPNVFTAGPPTISAISPFSSLAAHSVDRGLNERFVPLTESRSSSQSSGFESRQSTSSAFSPLEVIGGRQEGKGFSDRVSVVSGIRSIADSKWSAQSDTMGMSAFFGDDVFPR